MGCRVNHLDMVSISSARGQAGILSHLKAITVSSLDWLVTFLFPVCSSPRLPVGGSNWCPRQCHS
jgi:hypothetical protein